MTRGASAASRRKMVPEDLYRIILPSQPRISPDGAWVAFTRSHVDPESREYVTRIWRAPAAGGPAAQFTGGPGSDHSPVISPDGSRLAFVRRSLAEDDPGRDQIWIMPTGGGEAWPLTAMPLGAGAPVWSDDGRRLAFAARLLPGPDGSPRTRPLTAEERAGRQRRARNEGRRVTRLWHQADAAGGLRPDEPLQAWIVDVPDLPPAAPDQAPAPVPVTGGGFEHRPAAFSPDGVWLAVLGCHETDPWREFAIQDVWLYPVPGAAPGGVPAAPVNVTGGRGHFSAPGFSPDGRWVAAIGHENEQRWATHDRVWRFPAPGCAGEPACLTAGWDRSARDTVGSDLRGEAPPAAPHWSPDGQRLYFLASDAGTTQVWQVPAAGGDPAPVTQGPWQVFGWSIDAGCTRLALTATDFTSPGEVYALDLPGGAPRPLTDLNGAWRSEIDWPELTHMKVPSDGGWDLDAWLLKPAGWRPGVRYPLVLEVHGGPYAAYGYAFYQEFHLLAARGYAVLFANPRGSTGYSQALCAAIDGDYGGGDMRDLMAVLDAALATGWVDPGRLGVTGGSYGGFMTAWLIAQTDRFRAAVAHRGLYNWTSFAGVSDIGPWFTMGAHRSGPVWQDFGRLWQASPLAHVERIHTPLLICHSDGDVRTPLEQAEQLYTALRYLGREVELVRHPRSNHDLTRTGPPAVRVDRFGHILGWFGRWLDS